MASTSFKPSSNLKYLLFYLFFKQFSKIYVRFFFKIWKSYRGTSLDNFAEQIAANLSQNLRKLEGNSEVVYRYFYVDCVRVFPCLCVYYVYTCYMTPYSSDYLNQACFQKMDIIYLLAPSSLVPLIASRFYVLILITWFSSLREM